MAGERRRPSETATLASTLLGRRMPGITVDTASWLRMNRSASSGSVPASPSSSFFKASARSHTFRLRSPLKYWLRKSPGGNLEAGVIVPDGLVTHRMRLDGVREALDLMAKGSALKVLIEP